jgi:hypothetical protein
LTRTPPGRSAAATVEGSSASDVLWRGETMGQECESATAEVERLTRLRDEIELGKFDRRR